MAQKTSHLAATAKNSRTAKTTNKAFAEHVNELRMRVMWVVLVFLVTSAVAYNYRDFLVHLVMSPLGDQKLVYLTPAGGFSFILQITMYAGAVVTAPILIYHLYRFVVPALPPSAQRNSFKVILSAILLMVAGVTFGYVVAIPAALHFLTTFAGGYVQPNLTADSYLGFILAYVAGLGILFQLPLLLVFWNWISPLGPGKLMSSERFVIVFAFVAAAIMTPTPDMFNQTMVAVPIIGVYQLGVVAVLMANRSAARRVAKQNIRTERARLAAPQVDVPDDILLAATEMAREESLLSPAPAFMPDPIPVEESPPRLDRPLEARRPQGRTMDGIMPRQVARPQATVVPPRPVHVANRGVIRPSSRAMSVDGML
jgi:sec-independent protein translocase protein TatC